MFDSPQDLGPISKSELVRACEGAIHHGAITVQPWQAVASGGDRSLAGGDFSTVKSLLEESVDLNGTDSTGRTPLMFASGSGHLEADVGVKDTTLGHGTSTIH